MEKNHDPQIVVMDIARYQELMQLAEYGASDSGQLGKLKELLKHIRRFNTPIGTAFQEGIKEEQKKYLEVRSLIKELISKYQGKEVFVKQSRGCYKPAILIGRSLHSKELIQIETFRLGESDTLLRMDVRPNDIVTSIPSHFQLCVGGKWKNTYIDF